jgi:cytoskeletal protein CcmA (bactofilin family)
MNVVNYVQIGENTFLYGDGIRKSVLTGNLDICGSLTTNQFTAVNQNYGSTNSFETIYLSNIENSVNMNTITISSEFIDASNSSVSSIILIANNLDISNTTEINGILDVSTIFFRSGIDATNINICGDVIFNEDISFNHDVFINGDVDITNNVDICNNAIIKYDISVEHMIIYGNLTINGRLDTSDNEFVTDNIGTNALFKQIKILNIDLSGTTTLTFKDLSYIDASNSFLKNVTDISVQNLEVSNTIHVKENIIVDGYFNFRNYIGNYSSISGEIILSNHVDISNSGSGPALNIYHDVDDDIVLFKNNDGTVFKIDASGNSDFYKNVDISSLSIENNTSIQGNVSIHQNLDISNDLVIEGTIHNLEKIDISNNVNIYGNVDISHDYKTNPNPGNKNYLNVDIDGSGLEINIQTTEINTDVSFRTITTYSYTDISLDVSNISLTLLPVLVKKKSVYMFFENFFYNNWLMNENEEIVYTLYTTNVEYDNGKTGYMYQLVNSEDGEENEIGFDQLHFVGKGDASDPLLVPGKDFKDYDQYSYQEEEVSAEEAMKIYNELK